MHIYTYVSGRRRREMQISGEFVIDPKQKPDETLNTYSKWA